MESSKSSLIACCADDRTRITRDHETSVPAIAPGEGEPPRSRKSCRCRRSPGRTSGVDIDDGDRCTEDCRQSSQTDPPMHVPFALLPGQAAGLQSTPADRVLPPKTVDDAVDRPLRGGPHHPGAAD